MDLLENFRLVMNCSDKGKEALSMKRLFKRNIKDSVPIGVKCISYLGITLLSIICILPVLYTIMGSLTEEEVLLRNGYKLIPAEFSLEAYKYIFTNSAQVVRSFGVSVFSVIASVIFGVICMSMFAYGITRPAFPWRRQFQLFGFLPGLIPGSAVADYLVKAQWYGLKDTIWIYVFFGAISMFWILILCTYFRTSIPHEVIESAEIDGAGELTCCFKIAFPMALPVMATIALFITVVQWNDTNTPLMYLMQREDLTSLQLLLNRIQLNINFLQQMESSGAMSSTDIESVRQTIPSETFKLALSAIAMLPMIISYPFFQQYFISGMTVGSIK